ncbi:MAG: hypothetical protein K0S61_879 [Anaerocolumna sp.]|nr:hypothetical protein [Anaerocolumna sp.]
MDCMEYLPMAPNLLTSRQIKFMVKRQEKVKMEYILVMILPKQLDKNFIIFSKLSI